MNRTTWEVRIKGNPSDLRMLAEAFTNPKCRIVERGGEFFLHGTDFDLLTAAAAVRDRAREMVSSIPGASRLYLGSRITIGIDLVVRVHEDGRRDQALFLESAVIVLDAPTPSISFTRADGTVERHLPADRIVEALGSASESQRVRKVLRLRDRDELLWIDLTVVAEVIEADEFPLCKRERAALDRLTGSANHPDVAGDGARHGEPPWDPPPEHKRMTLNEGRAFIDRLIREWLAWNQAGRGDRETGRRAS